MGWCLKWRNPPPLLGVPLALLTLTLDYLTGPYIQFPILHLLPVSFVAWYAGFWPGLGLAIVLSLIRLLLAWIQPEIWLSPEVGINTAIRMLIFSVFAYLVAHTAKQTRELQKEVHILEGLLPICSFCKKIRTTGDTWEAIEKYISEHSEVQFSHSLCPDCAVEQYPDYFKARGG